jgi:hypothetical protein
MEKNYGIPMEKVDMATKTFRSMTRQAFNITRTLQALHAFCAKKARDPKDRVPVTRHLAYHPHEIFYTGGYLSPWSLFSGEVMVIRDDS